MACREYLVINLFFIIVNFSYFVDEVQRLWQKINGGDCDKAKKVNLSTTEPSLAAITITTANVNDILLTDPEQSFLQSTLSIPLTPEKIRQLSFSSLSNTHHSSSSLMSKKFSIGSISSRDSISSQSVFQEDWNPFTEGE